MIRLLIWVTSRRTLKCKHCSQAQTMREDPGYEMSICEVDEIFEQLRDNPPAVIELTGGEPSLWSHLEYGVRRFSQISEVTLVTNGNNPERIKALGLKTWIVSASQASPRQMAAYQGTPALYNSHEHKPLPTKPFEGVLPASCCVALSPEGKPQNNLMYYQGRIYYCCNAHELSIISGEDNSCDFYNDWRKIFSDKKYDKEICRYCICNHKIWNQL